MKNTVTRSFIYIAAIIFLAGAGVFAQSTRLAGTEWKLIEANGKAITRSSAMISIEDNGTRFTGSTGCNRMFGQVSASGRTIKFGSIGSTKMMCKLMAGNVAENVFLKALGDARTFRVSGNTLLLSDRRGRVVLRFRKVNETAGSVRLQDKKWVLESIKGRQTFVPLPLAFINFDVDKGTAGGDTSCNVFGGNYKVKGSSISFSKMISTMRACMEDNRMSVERDMLDGLRDVTRFEIKDNSLSLYHGNSLLLRFRGENK